MQFIARTADTRYAVPPTNIESAVTYQKGRIGSNLDRDGRFEPILILLASGFQQTGAPFSGKQDRTSKRFQLGQNLTLNNPGWGGDHEFKAGWDFASVGMFREGDWGRVNVDSRIGRSCEVTVPEEGSKGKELAMLDLVGTWAKGSGFALTGVRETKPNPRGFTTVSETWSQTGGANKLAAYAYIDRHSTILLSDISIRIAAP